MKLFEIIEKEEKILKEIEILKEETKKAPLEERAFFENASKALARELTNLNALIPEILDEKEKIEGKKMAVRIPLFFGKIRALEKKEKILDELKIGEEMLKAIKKKREEKEIVLEYQNPSQFLKISSAIFSGISKKGFSGIEKSLQKANMPYLPSAYISMAILSSLISFFLALLLSIFLFINFKNAIFFLFLLLPLIVFFLYYAYPFSQASAIRRKIEDELPFAVIHMAAIAGSGVEPSKIFFVIALSKEYPSTSREMRKVVNMINFYGYDLVTALRETAKTTSCGRFADALNGIATTIVSGGDIKDYLEKIASDMLGDYKMKRKKYTAAAGTFADIYTGLLIAAPLIFMLLLAIISIIGVAGVSPGMLGIGGIGAIIILNIGFLVFLQISQPE